MALNANMRAALFMTLSMSGFVINDSFIRTVGDTMNPGQIMFLRGIIMAIFLGAFMGIKRTPLHLDKLVSLPMGLRILGEAVGAVLFLLALNHMPFANISAILQALPLAVTAGAALFLGEHVGWRRLVAIVVGLAGVLLIIRPGSEGFNGYALLILATVVFAAIRDLATRKLDPTLPTLTVTLATTIAISVLGFLLAVVLGGFASADRGELAMLASASIFLFVGYQALTIAMRTGEIAAVAPFRYTSLLWAIGIGIVAFGEVPDLPMLAGAAIVVATGIYTLYRERKVARRAAAANLSAMNPPPGRGT